MVRRFTTTDRNFEELFQKFLETKRESDPSVNQIVSSILSDVKLRGDKALIEYTRKFDRFEASAKNLIFSEIEILDASMQCDPKTLDALEKAASRIEDFHKYQVPDDLDYVDQEGIRLGYRWKAINAAGLYVPGGTASYPSSVLMNSLPAKVAGVKRIVMVVPTPDNIVSPVVMAAAKLAGVTEIYKVGGAQAIAALAYGTKTIQPVDKIVGPGNAYVAAAKRQVFGTVGIDMIAGPSEILVVADGHSDPEWIAADLLSQAEHDVSSQSILVTSDAHFADSVCDKIDKFLNTIGRSSIASESWQNFGAVILVENLEQASKVVDQVAPEHLEIALEDADEFSKTIRNAGSIFLGSYVPEALGDYMAGPNHVLPTARSARFSSGLSVLDFMKRSTFIQCDSHALNKIGPTAATLARAEGLDAHALSIEIRLNN